jgi:predicted nucleic acid-binding protein
MIVLDTNVLSELMRPSPDAGVEHWVASQPAASLFTTTITQAEILFGISTLPTGARRSALQRAATEVFETDLAGRVLPFDSPAANSYAALAAKRRKSGKPISQFDAQIAAIAESRGAAIASRNIQDFAGCGPTLINPWDTQI